MIDANGDGVPDRKTDSEGIMAFNRKSRRDAAIAAFLKFAKKEASAGHPLIICGDFNEGSHLDWTKKAKESFGHYGVELKWDNSRATLRGGRISRLVPCGVPR